MYHNEYNSLDSLDSYLAQSNNHIDSELIIESNLISIGENIEKNELFRKVLKESKKNELKNNNINYERNSDNDLKNKISFTDICKIEYNTINEDEFKNEEDLQIIIENGSLTQKFPKISSSKKSTSIQKGKQLISKKRGRKKKIQKKIQKKKEFIPNMELII